MKQTALSRRDLLAAATALGIGNTTFQRAIAAEALAEPGGPVTAEMVKNAEWIAGITLTDAQRKEAAGGMTRALRDFAALHKAAVGNHVEALALHNRMLKLWNAIAGDNRLAVTKYTLSLQGVPTGNPRAPMTPASPAQQKAAHAALAELIGIERIRKAA